MGLVSQNCDGLHLRSGVKPQQIAELHGNKNVEACAECGRVYWREFRVRSASTKTRKTERVCDNSDCRGAPLRYTTVAFNQSMPDVSLARAEAWSKDAALALVAGTSMRVEPAASLPLEATHLVLCNMQKTPADKRADVRVFGRVDVFMQLLAEELQLDVQFPCRERDLANDVEFQAAFVQHWPFRSVQNKPDWFERDPKEKLSSDKKSEKKKEKKKEKKNKNDSSATNKKDGTENENDNNK